MAAPLGRHNALPPRGPERAGPQPPHPDQLGQRRNQERGTIHRPLFRNPGSLRHQSQRGLQPILCSSDVSIAGRIGKRLQRLDHHHPQKVRGPRGRAGGQWRGTGMSGGGAVTRPPPGDDTGMAPPEKDALLPSEDADLPQGVADLPLLLGAGLPLHHLADAPPPPDGTLHPSSGDTAPLLWAHRKEGCQGLPLPNAYPRCPSAVPPGPLSAGVPLPKRDAHLPHPPLPPDTGEAPCSHPTDQAGTLAHPPLLTVTACPLPLPTVAEPVL